jgi:hypothetical protein
MAKWPPLVGTQIVSDGLIEAIFLEYTIKIGKDSIINMNLGITRAADKWQGYFHDNYRYYWL